MALALILYSIAGHNKLLLGNADVFQLWEISETADGNSKRNVAVLTSAEMTMLFEGRNSSPTVKFLGVHYTSDGTTVVTRERESFMLWDLAQRNQC